MLELSFFIVDEDGRLRIQRSEAAWKYLLTLDNDLKEFLISCS